MKTANYVVLGILTVSSALVAGRAWGQAPPGPLPQPKSQPKQEQNAEPPRAAPAKAPEVQPRTSLAGAWRFNQDQSDDPRQRVRAAESAGGNYPGTGSPGGYPGGGYPGGGYPGGYPRGPWGGRPYPGGGPQYGGRDIEDNPRMQPLLRAAESMTLDVKDGEVDVADDHGRKLVMYTDGRKLPKPTDDSHLEVAAHWDGSQLVSDEKSPLGGKMSRTFELSRDGRQLYETLHIDTGRSGAPIVIRYVYDIPIAGTPNREDSDPNRPVLRRHTDDSGVSSQ
jgi:hypothetical protein